MHNSSRTDLMLMWKESTLSIWNPPDHRHADLSIIRTHRRLSRSTRGQWYDNTQFGSADK